MENLYKDKGYLFKNFVEQRKTATQIAKELEVNSSTIEYYLSKYGLFKLRSRSSLIFNVNKLALVPEVYYFLGLVCTDGYIDVKNNRLSIRLRNEGAEEVLTKLKNYFEFNGKIHFYKGKDYDLTLPGKELFIFLQKLGITNLITKEKLIPNIFPTQDCARLFLRGCLDGDGNIHLLRNKVGNYYAGQFRIVKGSPDFIQGIQRLLNNYLNIDCPISLHKTSKGVYPKLELKVSDSKKFYKWVYMGYPDYRLKDKFTKATHLVGDIV